MVEDDRPLFAAGLRIEPPISVPMPKQLPRNPIRAPSPPEEPPDVNVVLKGLVVTLFHPLAQIQTQALPFNSPIDVTTSLQMHQTLWLRSPHIKYSASPPQNLQNTRIPLRDPPNPTHKPSIEIKTFHPNVFLYADWDTVQGTNWLLVFFEVGIEVCGTFEGSCGKEFRDAICLRVSLAGALWMSEREMNVQLSAQVLLGARMLS
jgi:type III secretory pathway component EscS